MDSAMPTKAHTEDDAEQPQNPDDRKRNIHAEYADPLVVCDTHSDTGALGHMSRATQGGEVPSLPSLDLDPV